MTTDEMLKMLDDWMATLRPLYLQLHTWTKYKLAEKYHQPVPKKIPAHWINNRWAQEWEGLVEAANIDKYFEGRKPEWIIKTAEQFYTGLGFSPLPQSFWEKSDLYPVPPDSTSARRTLTLRAGISTLRTTFARSQSIEPNSRWFYTAHHELGHGYYFKAYTRPEVPYLLANRRRARIPRRRRRIDFARLQSGALSAITRRSCQRTSSRTRPRSCSMTLSPARCRSSIFPAGPCRIGKPTFTRRNLAGRSMERALVEIRQRHARDRATVTARRRILRCRHQDAHQRYSGLLLQLRFRDCV